jgi:coenzyme F420-reducing hydrogenase beta subunit
MTMMQSSHRRIALMTWFTYHNYGTSLQSAALYQTLRGLGYEVDVIDYSPRGIRRTNRPMNPSVSGFSKKAIRKIERHFASSPNYSPKGREILFEAFLDKKLSFTTPCPTMADLEGLNDSYDTFVCGSDQIWSPPNFDPHFFLDFAGNDRLKIAYAPSVGLPCVDNQDIAMQMSKLCGRIDVLSTREESGSRIVSDLTGRKVATVVDPTLLLDREEWVRVASETDFHIEEPYLLAYMLGHDERQWGQVYALGKRLGLSVRVIPVFLRDLEREGCITEPVGPLEFVSLIAKARYVCTDSFHGVAFSVNLGVEFCAFERFKRTSKINQNSRIYNLLDKVGLRGRLMTGDADDEALTDPIDWEGHEKRLSEERRASFSWLEDALKIEPKVSKFKNNICHNRTLCCGCTACETVCPVDAITVQLDAEGFWRARVDENACVSCGKCRRVCPFIDHSSSNVINDGKLFSYKNSNHLQLLQSSSGGAGAAIAKSAVESGMAVLGCSFEAGKGAVGKLVEPKDSGELAMLAGSKYMQSRMGDALAEAAAHKGPVLITGTPCQVAAARNLLGERDDIAYVDLICHGVPTRYLYERYLEWLSKEYGIDSRKAEISFRYKPKGWHERYICTSDGVHETCLHQRRDPYFLMFEAGQCYAPCCYECPWRNTSAADVRLGDYWGPRFQEDKTGVSMVLALTERGSEVVNGLVASGELHEQPVTDYVGYQQTENDLEPVFRADVIRKLADPSIGAVSVSEEFAEPVARKRELRERIEPFKSFAKRLLGRK